MVTKMIINEQLELRTIVKSRALRRGSKMICPRQKRFNKRDLKIPTNFVGEVIF